MLITNDMKLKYENERGMAIELSFFSPFTLQACEEELENEINSQKQAAGHGETYLSSSMEPRRIAIEGVLCGKAEAVLQNAERLRKVFNPTLSGVLSHIDIKGEKRITCRVEETPFLKKQNGLLQYEIDLTAHQPFWEETERSEYIALLTKRLTFPLVIPPGGMCFGLRKPILETKVSNLGDVESGFRVVFKARGGTVKTPQLTNKATGEFIKVNYTMEKDDLVEIVNYPERKEILLNGVENGFPHLDIDSDFFNLAVGDNLIGYRAEENTINLDVVIYYTPRYLGV